jgi:hypothetical protein
VEQREFINKKAVMGWYRYASQRPGFVGFALRLVRERTGQSKEEQRHEFGTDEQSFLHLQGMPLPRSESLPSDANRIAETCGLSNSMAFIKAMILAQSIERSSLQPVEGEFYMAAFDDTEDLDSYPEED